MSWHDPFRVIPNPSATVVHERKKPSAPFGFRRGSGIDWKPAAPERRVRDEDTVEWARRIREES